VWTYRDISADLRLPFRHPNEKLPTFSGEVGCGRRLRGNANGEYILGGILLEKQQESMVLPELVSSNLVVEVTHRSGSWCAGNEKM